MIASTRSCLASVLLFLPLALGCSAASDAGDPRGGALTGVASRAEQPQVVQGRAQAMRDRSVYRLQSGSAPDWMLRVTRSAGRIDGHVVRYVSVRESSSATPGQVAGQIDASGTITLSIEPPEPWSPMGSAPRSLFRGVETAEGLEGTLQTRGATEHVVLTAVAPGETDETGAPLVSTLRLVPAAACAVDVTAVEFFALENELLERRLNALLARTANDAARHCGPAIDAVSGGSRVTLLRHDIVSVANAHSLLRIDEVALAERPERHTYDLASGDELALFGDVLNVGSEGALFAALEASIDRLRPDVLGDEDRHALVAHVKAAVGDGRLAARYGLTEDALVFDVLPEFVHARVSNVRVRYDDLRGIRAESGRAQSAWAASSARHIPSAN